MSVRDPLINVVNNRSHVNTPGNQELIHLYRYSPDGIFYGKLSDGTSVPIGGGVMDTIWKRSFGPSSAVLIDQGDTNEAGGDFAVAYGTNSKANSKFSSASGDLCETGLVPNDFTCLAGGTTLTISGINVASSYSVGQSYRVLYTSALNQPSYKNVIIFSSTFTAGDTVLVINSSIDSTTISGRIYDYKVGTGADASGYKAISRGDYSFAQGQDVQALAQGSQAKGTMTRAKGVESKSDGTGAISTGYRESSRGFGFYTDSVNPDDIIGQNMRRELGLYRLHSTENPEELYLDGTVNEIIIPFNCIALLYIDLIAIQIDSSLPDYGDCLAMQWRIPIKSIGGVITQVGGGGNVLPAAGLTKSDGVGSTWVPSMSLSTSQRFKFFLTAQSGVRSQIVVWAKQIAKLD